MPPTAVSIAMCTFNGARFLRDQLDSFSTQTRLPDEIVICDDGSTDETLKILADWAKSAPFKVQIVQNERNLGYAKNFEKAIDLCQGEIIFLSDQDDIWLPQKIDLMANLLESTPDSSGVICEAYLINSQNERLPYLHSDISREFMGCFLPCFLSLPENKLPLLSGCCSVFRKKVLNTIPDVQEGWPHDSWFFLFAQTLGKVLFVSEPLICRRIHDSNTSGVQASYDSINEKRKKVEYFYQNAPGTFLFLEKKISEFETALKILPETEQKVQLLRKIQRGRQHFLNRERIQRNTLKFFPLAAWELVTGRYGDWPKPLKAFFFDLKKGLGISSFAIKENK